MFGLRIWLAAGAVVFAAFGCARSLPPVEESARAVMRGLIARDFEALTVRFSGAPLQALLASGSAQNFEYFCQRLVPVMPPPTSWTIRFARAMYQDDGSQVLLRLCLLHGAGEDLRLYETYWRMQYIDGGWKLVAY
jgi:hypothetical protein